MNRTMLSIGVACTVGLSLAAGAVRAETYPSKPVRLVVPYAPGGFSDVVGRAVAQRFSEGLGQAVVVENRAGASSIIGAATVAKAAADGYTLFFSTQTPLSINQHLFNKLPYNPEKDFVAVGKMGVLPYVLIAHPSVPANTLKELIDYAKANPGKLNMGAPGNGTQPHLAMKQLEIASGARFTAVQYKGAGPALIDLLSGQIQLLIDGLLVPLPHVQTGKLKALAVTSPRRFPSLPDLPAVAESYPGFDAASVYFLMAPAGTPREIINRLNAEVQKFVNDPATKERMLAQGAFLEGGTPEEATTYLRAETLRWAAVTKHAGLKLD